ncbi:MAG: magnesium/cobalt transporter CorA, partial [Bacilli bacterium]
WADYAAPTPEEVKTLHTHFHFHPLAIEDCLHFLQRPKMDYYDDVSFLVLHACTPDTHAIEEVDLFVSEHFIVSFHLKEQPSIARFFDRVVGENGLHHCSSPEVLYQILDDLVDDYFPIVEGIEDTIMAIEDDYERNPGEADVMTLTFEVRKKLLSLRRSVMPMRDLLYRILESKRFALSDARVAYFYDIHDHLTKLCEMIEANRELTVDIRENYVSYTSLKMNHIMKTLTVITTIFMPLTFIAGVYGMNFVNMPELRAEYGYFIILGAMGILGFGLFYFFYRKGWFDRD